MRPELSPESLRKSRSFSKAPLRCPARERQFSQHQVTKKPPETSGFAAFDGSSTSMIEGWRLEPFLVRRQLQPGMDRRDPRVDKRRPVLRRHSHMLHVLTDPRMVLGIHRGRTGDSERSDAGDGKL